jgi:D-arabinose 1-dehydrogenase-like Zn-dependent alcohol dehydrogenase
MLPGGLAQYGVIGKEILRGDEGLYLIPVRETTGYAEAALTEPWACVEAAYSIPHRAGPKDGGLLWAVGNGAAGEYRLGGDVRPRRAVLSNVPESLAAELREQGGRFGFEVIETNDDDYAALWQRQTDGHGFDDIIVLGSASAELVEQVESFIGRLGVIVLVAAEPLNRKVVVDVGRIHYDYFQHVGTTGREVLAAYRLNTRSELKAGGSVWFVGAAGPMGHMHVQRAIETTNGARAIVATDLVATRIGELIDKFAEPAKAKGIRLVTLTVEELGPETYHARLCQEAGPGGFDDIVVLAPAARAVAEAGEYLGEGGVLNIFAGLPRGTKATLDLSGVYLKNQRLHGSSGSTIDDLRRMLKKTESGALSTNRSVYAISGMHGVRDGFEAVIEGRFAGKVVVFPSIADLGLMPLVELKEKLPKVYAKLDGGRTWTNEAEEELLRELLPEGGEDA